MALNEAQVITDLLGLCRSEIEFITPSSHLRKTDALGLFFQNLLVVAVLTRAEKKLFS